MASDELMSELAEKERPAADRTMPYEIVANNLELFGTSRADFRQLSEEERVSIGKRIGIHLSRQRVDGTIMEWERPRFFHMCGDYGIDYNESKAMWHNATEGMQWDEVHEEVDE